MSILKYNDYISEKVVYDLLLESKLVYSSKFIKFLNKMKDNKIAKSLADLYTKDVEVQHNYVDTSDEKDAVTFTPDRKVQELEKDKEEVYIVIDSGRYLTNARGNHRVYDLLKFPVPENVWAPEKDTIGVILGECVSPSSGRTYVLFKGINEWEGKQAILNKEAVAPSEGSASYKIWTTSRNKIKIGRLVRAILTAAKISFVDRDIEEFVNLYKATYDMMANALLRFEIVKGDDIAYWYKLENYAENRGVLGNSCMAEAPKKWLKIYTKNPETVSMIILYDENGKMEDGKYKSDKIMGRCILWDTNEKGKVMDRIYTAKDNDVELFKEFAKKNGFSWKRSNDSDNDFTLENGTTSEQEVSLTVSLEKADFEHYPYLDTFFFLNTDKSRVSNDSDKSWDRELRSTGGGYDEN